ncbi:hypothetical protein Esti_001456 [Eimeria stiedai]
METSCMQRCVREPLEAPAKKSRPATTDTGAPAAAAATAAAAKEGTVGKTRQPATAAESETAAAATAAAATATAAATAAAAAATAAAAAATAAAAAGTLDRCCSPSVETPSTRASATRGCYDSGIESEADTPQAKSKNHSAAAAAADAAAALAGSPRLTADPIATTEKIREGKHGVLQLWSPNSWRGLAAPHDPFASIPSAAVSRVYGQLRCLPPLVSASEVASLLSFLSLAQQGKAFLLQGGHCAERFCCCREETLRETAGLLMQLGAIIEEQLKVPVCVVGRLAGQYGKPRTQSVERQGERMIMTYRGDAVNGDNPNDRVGQGLQVLFKLELLVSLAVLFSFFSQQPDLPKELLR